MKALFTTVVTLFVISSFAYSKQLEATFKSSKRADVELNYLLHLPDSYDPDTSKEWPMILFLHGSGERGSDLKKVKKHGPPKIVEKDQAFPFIVVSPQCPNGVWWNSRSLKLLTEEIIDIYKVDSSRVYLTGLSMGGYGTWALASEYPGLFAAIAPICGGGDPKKAARMKNTPTWVFHGEDDTVVPIGKSEEMVSALTEAGGNVRFTRYEKTGHNSWTKAYAGSQLYDWFLEHVKAD